MFFSLGFSLCIHKLILTDSLLAFSLLLVVVVMVVTYKQSVTDFIFTDKRKEKTKEIANNASHAATELGIHNEIKIKTSTTNKAGFR